MVMIGTVGVGASTSSPSSGEKDPFMTARCKAAKLPAGGPWQAAESNSLTTAAVQPSPVNHEKAPFALAVRHLHLSAAVLRNLFPPFPSSSHHHQSATLNPASAVPHLSRINA